MPAPADRTGFPERSDELVRARGAADGATIRRTIDIHGIKSLELGRSWETISTALDEAGLLEWIAETDEVELVIEEGAPTGEESADAYGTTALRLLTTPITPGGALQGASHLAGWLDKARQSSKKKPYFTIHVVIHTRDLKAVAKEDWMGALRFEKRVYLTLAHEIGVHAVPRLIAVRKILQRTRSTALDFLNLAKGLEEEHAKVYPRKEGELPENPLYMALVGRRMQGEKDPLYTAFIQDVARYEEHEAPLVLAMLESKIKQAKLAELLASVFSLKGAAAVTLVLIFCYFFLL